MGSKLVCLLFVVAGTIALASCAKIEEPWVRAEDQLQAERSRSLEQQQALRQRLFLDSGYRNSDWAN
ncbi:MAG: hypothetical protein ACE5K1_02105 [Acidiferrobacterales bacterium]